MPRFGLRVATGVVLRHHPENIRFSQVLGRWKDGESLGRIALFEDAMLLAVSYELSPETMTSVEGVHKEKWLAMYGKALERRGTAQQRLAWDIWLVAHDLPHYD